MFLTCKLCLEIQVKAFCISHSANTLEKGMRPVIPLPCYGKIFGHTGIFNLVMATGSRTLISHQLNLAQKLTLGQTCSCGTVW